MGALVQSKVQEAAEKQIKANISMSPLSGNPVTGFTASNVEISRSGDRLLFVRNIGVDISLPSILRGKPRVSLIGLNGVDTSLENIQELLPKSKKPSNTPTDIPIDAVLISDSTLRTRWGTVKFDPSHVYIDNSFYYNLDLTGTVNGKKFTTKGTIEKVDGVWTAKDFKAGLEGGSVAVDGAVYPSMDMKLSLAAFNLSDAAELAPQLDKFGIKGVLSGGATVKSVGGGFVSQGSGNLHNAVVKGIPLEQLDAKWDVSPGVVKLDVSQGVVFNSSLSGSFYFNASRDNYMELKANVKNLKFADWSPQFEKETNGQLMYLKGAVSSFKADISGPRNALKGRIDLSPSTVGYKEVVIKDLAGSAVFTGGPSGVFDMTGTAEGKKVAVAGRLSLGDKTPTAISFSLDGYPIEKVLKSLPKPPKVNVSGTAAVRGSCSGLYGSWIILAQGDSKLVSADKVGRISNISLSGAYAMKDKKLSLTRGAAQWNGAYLTAVGSASLAASADKRAELSGTFRNVSANRFYNTLKVLDTLGVDATASGTWRLGGTLSSPAVTANIVTGAGRFRDLKISKFSTRLEWSGASLRMEPMNVWAGGGRGTLVCDVKLPVKRADGTKQPVFWKVSGRIADVDASAINGLLKSNEQLSGSVTGNVSAQNASGGLAWSCSVTGDSVKWKKYMADTLKAELSGTPSEITLKSVNGTFLKGALAVSGTISMPKKGEKFSAARLDLRARGDKLNVYELLRKYMPSVRGIQGLVGSEAVITGTAGDPQFSGTGRLAPFRWRGFMLPMIDLKYRGDLRNIVVSDADAVLRDGSVKGYGRVYVDGDLWYGSFNVKGSKVDMKQFGAYLPENFRKRFGGTADFSVKGQGKLSEISGSGSFNAKEMRVMGVRFDDLKAPFFLSQHYVIIEDLKASTYGGTLTGGVAFDLSKSLWGGNLTVMSADLKPLLRQSVTGLKGVISGRGDLKIRGGGETGRLSTVKGGGAIFLHDGAVTSFDAVESAKKYTGGRPLRFQSVRATFTYDGGDFNLLPGSQATAPAGDPLYRYVMLDGTINRKKQVSFFMMGKINVRALNSIIGAFQGLVTAGIDLASGELNKNEMVQNILGGVISGMAKNEFRFLTMNIGGTATDPKFYNIKVENAVKQTSAKEGIPTSQSDPDAKDLQTNGNTTFRFKFEIPVGPGLSQQRGDAKGQVVEQTLENLLKNVDFGLK